MVVVLAPEPNWRRRRTSRRRVRSSDIPKPPPLIAVIWIATSPGQATSGPRRLLPDGDTDRDAAHHCRSNLRNLDANAGERYFPRRSVAGRPGRWGAAVGADVDRNLPCRYFDRQSLRPQPTDWRAGQERQLLLTKGRRIRAFELRQSVVATRLLMAPRAKTKETSAPTPPTTVEKPREPTRTLRRRSGRHPRPGRRRRDGRRCNTGGFSPFIFGIRRYFTLCGKSANAKRGFRASPEIHLPSAASTPGRGQHRGAASRFGADRTSRD